MGGSALAQVYSQIGNISPDLDNVKLFATAWDLVQELIEKDMIVAGMSVCASV